MSSVVRSVSCVQFFVTPWTAACQASLSFTISQSSLKFMSISWWWHTTISSSVFPFSPCLQSFPASGSFPMNWLFTTGDQSIAASASALPMNIQDWFPLGWTGWISLLSRGLWRVFSSTTGRKHQFFEAQPSWQSNSHFHTWPTGRTTALTRRTFVCKVMSLLFNMLSRFIKAFLPSSKCPLFGFTRFLVLNQTFLFNLDLSFLIPSYVKMLNTESPFQRIYHVLTIIQHVY